MRNGSRTRQNQANTAGAGDPNNVNNQVLTAHPRGFAALAGRVGFCALHR
jgi:hypothetical protein